MAKDDRDLWVSEGELVVLSVFLNHLTANEHSVPETSGIYTN